MSDALPPTTSEPAPFQPIDFGTWESTPEAARVQDPLQKIQAYDNRLRKDLFAAGMYDAEAEAEIAAAGADQAIRQGLIASPEEYAPVAKPRDPGFLARQLTRKGDSAKAQDIFRYQSFLSRPDTDPETLERARLAAQLDPETENELVRSAVRSGELPFAVVSDKDGNPVFEIDPELGALDRQQILDLAGDDVDPRFLPDLERQLTRVTGTNYTPAQFRQAAVFDSFLKRQAAEDPFLGDVLQRAQTEYDRTGQLSTETQEELDRNLAALDADNEFAPATRARLIRDTIKRGSKPEAYDPENPQQHIQYLEDGTVWLPEQVIFDQAKHDTLLDSLDITPEQREAAKKLRAGRLDAIAPSMVDAMGADPDALEFFEKSKAAGKTDAEIATEWYSKPENYGSFSNRARSFGMSLIEAGPGLVQSVAALAGSDSAREALAARAQDTARNEEYARLFGDSYGVGQSLLNTSSQVAADLLAGLAVSAVATPVAGAAVAGSRAAASSLVRGLARTALTEGARSTAAGFLRSATGSAARTLATMGDDVATNLARSIASQTGVAASSFTRSAGSAYVQAYSALDAQTNAQGQPLYSDAEKRKIALGTAMTAGTATAAITLGFGKLLGPGVEGLVTGKLGTSALRRLFGATDDQIISATRESALAILKSAGQEAPEEAVDQLVGNVIQAVGTGEEFRLGPALKEALEAGLVGGLLGAGTKSIELGVDKFRSPKVEALEKAGAPATAAALEAATKAQAEAPAAQPTVINQDGLRIQDNPPLSPDPFTYGEEDPDAPNPVLEPSAPPVYEPGDLAAGYGDEPAVGITDTGGAVRVSAAEIEGQIDAVDVQLADLKVVPANETEGQKARRTRRIQELSAEKVRLKAAVKNARASGGFVFLAQERPVQTTPPTAAPTPEPAETALDYGDGSPPAVQDNTLAGPTPGSTVPAPQPAATPSPEAIPDPEDIVGTDQAPEPPDVEAVPEPGDQELDYGDGGELVVQDNTLGGPAPTPAPKSQTTKATKFSRKARALVERMLTPEARTQPPEYLQQQKAFTPTQTRIQSRIAALYEALPVDDSANPEVVQAYRNLVTEVVAQYRAMLATGIKIEMGSENPYATSSDMIDDVERGRLWIYKTEPGSYGSDAMLNAANHPMLAPTEFTDLNGEPMLANDVFRAVHDYVAHAAFGFSFGPLGEEAAWKAHLSTLRDPLARRALTTETRGQNSWVNYRPEMVRNGMPIKKGEPGYIAPQDRPFATQKFALLPEEAMTLVPIQTPAAAKKPTGEKQLAADVRQGKPLAVHQSLFDDTISQGWVPTRNVLLNQLKAAGFGGQVYGTAFSETVQARIRELYPLVDVPKTAVSKTLKSLGLGDIKVGNKLVSIPVNPDGTTAPFTNGPQVTAWQKAAGLSVKVPAGVTVNPAIKVNPKTGTVDSAIDQTGRAIASRGDVKRPGSVVGDYEAFQNKTPFGVSLMTLPPADFSTLPRPVDFAGYTIKPGETTEDDLLRYFVVAPTPGGQSRLEQAIESRAPKNFTSVQKEAVRSAAQLSFIREIREFMMGVNAAGNVDAAGFGHKTTQSYKKYLQDRAATVWSQAGKAKDGTVDTTTHWTERGRPSHLSFFVDTAIKAHTDAAKRRPDANVQLGSDDVDQETALERAAARNEAGDAGDTLVALDEAFTPEVLRGAAALIGTTDLMDTASGIQILVERLDSVPALRKAFERAYVDSLDLPPGPGARRALAIMQAKQMDASDLVVVAARAALVQPGVLQAVREAGFFKSLSYGLNTFTDAEVVQHRADNRAAIADLQLDGDLRSALERIARSAKYPRRYRAVMLAALKMPALPNLAIIDAPTEAYAGSYIRSGRLITLNIASSNGRGLLDVLAHELLHAATIDAVANPQTRAARELRDRLERARQKAADVVPADMAYAVSSLDEFITHAATDPRLQVILRETFERGKSTWQRVVEAIARFFGIANNDFVSDLWGFINHAAEYGYRVGVAASREPGPLSARFRPSSPDIRYSPADTSQVPDTGIDQHLPELPDGLAYAYDETRPRYLAYARRSQPGTVTINRAALASLVEGLDPANARAIVRKIVNHEIAHLAAFQAFTDAELDEMAAALSTSELADIARKYYGTPDSMQRMAADLASGTLTRAALVEEWLRSVAELVTDGGTTEETIAFHSANPGMVARILRYIRDYVRALWTRVAGPKEDFATRVSINRLMREYRDIKRGHLPPVAEPFDTSDPYRDNKRGALASTDTDPEATVLSDIMRRETFIDFAGAYTAPAKGWKGTLKQILQTRTGDPRFEAVKNERTGRLNAANQLLANRQKAMSKAIKAEKPDRDLVNRALGDSSPTIPTAVRKQLRADYESAVGRIRAFYNEQAQDANADLEQIALDEKAALREAYAEYDKLRRDALVETARAKKTAISAAMEELRAVAPQTAAAVKKFRSGIDSLSKVMRDTHPDDSFLHAVIDENLGVYLTRTYRAHHGGGDPLAILNSKDPADMETVAAAEKLFVDTIVEGRAEEIVEEEAENDRYISFDEALELARAWAAENELGRRALEDYIASHGSRAFYHGGGNFKIDLTRYMQKVDVPEALRKVLGEVNDPVENAARTFANVAHMAANFRFIEDLARGGKSSGALVTKAQKDGFADMVREADEDAYLQQTIDYGFARRKPAAGYVKVAGDIYHPAWLIEARANRDFQMLDAYEPLATTSAKYGAGSLDGLFAAPLVKALYENSVPKPPTLESEKMVHRFGSFFAKATGFSLGVATVTNPAFHARNALGGTLFLGANGINPFAGFGTVSQHFADLVAGKDNPEVTKRIALGIYSDDIRPQAIKELIKDEIDKPGDKSGFEWFGSLIGGKKGERIGELVATGALKLTDVASAIDSVLKGRAYEAELETLRKAYPDGSKTESELERMAAGIVKRTMQSRSMTVPIAEDVTRSSFGRLFAPFLRFKAEMFRITHGTVSQALDEIKSGNPVLRARGYQRMSGFVLVAAASLAGPALISALMGVGEEEEIALREALPPYLRGNSMVYVASGGSVTSLDLTFVNPYSMIFDPVSRSARALLRGEADKAPGELASWLHGQFLEEQIAAGAVLEVLNNRTSDNKPITLETDGFGDQVVKYSKHLLGSAYTPQVAKIVDRAIEAQRRGVPEDAEFFETPAGVLSTAIVPARPRTYEASELALRAFKSKAQTLRDIRTKQGRLKIRQNLDARDVNEIVLDQFESMSSLYEDLGRIARGYEGLGLTKAQVIKEMVNAGHSREKARGVVAAGYVPAPSLTPAAKRDIFDAGQEVDKNGGGERRVRLVVEAQRALPRVIEIDGAEGED